MKRKININKINLLLKNNKKTKKELAIFIQCPESNLCAGLSKSSKRTLSMDYIIEIAKFFGVEPKDLTVPTNTDNTASKDNITRVQGQD